MANSLNRNRRIYLQDQADLLTIPNTAGTATLARANYCNHIDVSMDLGTKMLVPPDVNGTRTVERGVPGRKMSTWSLKSSLRGSGNAAALPPLSPVFNALFGQVATVSAAATGNVTGATNASPVVITQVAHGYQTGDVVRITNVGGNKAANGAWVITRLTADTYSLLGSVGSGAYTSGGTAARSRINWTLTDDILSFVLWLFRTPATLQQRVAYGCLARQLSLQLGSDIAEITAEGHAPYQLDSDTFPTEDPTLVAGLSAFPAEPTGALPTDGGIIAGFTGRAVFGTNAFANIRQATVQVVTGNDLVQDNFGTFTPNEALGDIRSVTTSFTVNDNDSAAVQGLYAAFLAKTPVNIVYQIGTAANNTFVIQLGGVQFDSSSLDNSQLRIARSYNNCRATGSAPGALDEIKLSQI